jgi:hypothetical protein
MQSRISPKDQALFRAIGEVLHYVWDPIGVAGVPQARDEYDGYVGELFSLIRSGATEVELSSRLEEIAGDRMGLGAAKDRSDEAASAIMDWRDFVDESLGLNP